MRHFHIKSLAGVLFVLLLAGPPSFRFRDPLASIRGEVDASIIVVVGAWCAAGLWVAVQLVARRARGLGLGLCLPQKIGLLLVLCLALSLFVSPAMGLTGFKTYQILVALLFGWLFVQRFGITVTLDKILVAQALLCLAVIVAAVLEPSLVDKQSLYGYRIRGDAIVLNAGQVAVFGLILVLSSAKRRSYLQVLVLSTVFGAVLILSRTRTAYIVFFGFLLALLLFRRTNAATQRVMFGLLGCTPLLLFQAVRSEVLDWVVRDPSELLTLSDRVGLWSYLARITWDKSFVVGLGYWAASRIYGPQYNSNLGAAHSVVIEVFSGAGVLGLTSLIVLWTALAISMVKLMRRDRSESSLAICSLLCASILFSLLGWGELGAGPVGMTFWSLAAITPRVNKLRLQPDPHNRNVERL